jgi:hypothetical protein
MERGDLQCLGIDGKIKVFDLKKSVQNCVGLHLSQRPVAHSCDHGDEALDSIKDGKFLYNLNSSLWRKTCFVPHVMKYVVIYCVLDAC